MRFVPGRTCPSNSLGPGATHTDTWSVFETRPPRLGDRYNHGSFRTLLRPRVFMDCVEKVVGDATDGDVMAREPERAAIHQIPALVTRLEQCATPERRIEGSPLAVARGCQEALPNGRRSARDDPRAHGLVAVPERAMEDSLRVCCRELPTTAAPSVFGVGVTTPRGVEAATRGDGAFDALRPSGR